MRRAFLFGQFSRQRKAEYFDLQNPLSNQTTGSAEISGFHRLQRKGRCVNCDRRPTSTSYVSYGVDQRPRMPVYA